MDCIYCGNDTRVINSRPQKRANSIWRRRQCAQCSSVFTTIEETDYFNSLVITKNEKQLEPFNRDVLFISIYEACRHRPTALNDAQSLTVTILSKLLPLVNQATIARNDIVHISSTVLTNFDKAAAVSYKAFHPSR